MNVKDIADALGLSVRGGGRHNYFVQFPTGGDLDAFLHLCIEYKTGVPSCVINYGELTGYQDSFVASWEPKEGGEHE